METLIHLLSVFSQLSVLGFGGGKGIIPQMHTDAVTTYRWVTSEQFTQFYTIGKLVPGPTTIFAALSDSGATAKSAVGSGGCDGGHVRTVEPHHDRLRFAGSAFSASPWRAIISRGLAPAIVGLVWSSVWTIARGAPSSVVAYATSAVVVALMLHTKINAPLLILLSGGVGIAALR